MVTDSVFYFQISKIDLRIFIKSHIESQILNVLMTVFPVQPN